MEYFNYEVVTISKKNMISQHSYLRLLSVPEKAFLIEKRKAHVQAALTRTRVNFTLILWFKCVHSITH